MHKISLLADADVIHRGLGGFPVRRSILTGRLPSMCTVYRRGSTKVVTSDVSGAKVLVDETGCIADSSPRTAVAMVVVRA